MRFHDLDDNMLGAGLARAEREGVAPASATGSLGQQAVLLHEQTVAQESESFSRLLLDSTVEAIYGVDLEGRCSFVNLACLKLLGYQQAEEMVGQYIYELIHHSHANGVHYPSQTCRIYQAYLHDEKIHLEDEVFWHKDGHPVPVECWSYPKHRDGKVVGAVATFFDITERRQAEDRQRLAGLVFEHTRDGVMVTDTKGCVLTVNHACTEITGYSETEARGKRPSLLHSGRHGAAFYQAMWVEILASGFWQDEIWNRRKNGEIYPEWLTINAVRDSLGMISHYLGVSTDLSQIKRSEAQLDHLVHHDPLTDLPNRIMLKERLAHALERARRQGQQVGVLHIDLDNFKLINDSLGPTTGDVLLMAVVQRLRGRVRNEDTLGRLGGDNFLLLLQPVGSAREVAEIARDLLALMTPAFAQLELNADLRRALERGELEVHYQPKVTLRHGRIVGAEALLRWRRPNQGDGSSLTSPAQFIPLAEKTGLIVPIGTWVIDTVCRQIREWLDQGLSEVSVAVNVSACQLRTDDFDRQVSMILERHGVPAHYLELELTESMLMQDPTAAAAMLKRLKLSSGKALPMAPSAHLSGRTLLLVDDEAHILTALRRMLRQEGYRVLTASSAHEGLDLLAMNDIQVILSDQRMPEMLGTEFLSRVKELHPDAVRIVLSGYAELSSIIEAVNQGAIYKFLIKPSEDDLLRAHIRDAFRYHVAVVKPRSGVHSIQ